MNRDSLSHALVGGSIEQYDFDIRRNRLTMRIGVLENGVLSVYAIEFEKVSRFEFETESKSDAGEHLELTEIWIEVAPEASRSEEWEVTVSVFDMTHLHVRCSTIWVDGELLK